MTPELKKLGEMVLADPLLRNKVVVAKVRSAAWHLLYRMSVRPNTNSWQGTDHSAIVSALLSAARSPVLHAWSPIAMAPSNPERVIMHIM